MTASVTIDRKAWGDVRFAVLAKFMGVDDPDVALVKMGRIWGYCTEEETKIVPVEFLEAILGIPADRVAADLERSKLGDDLGDGTVRIRGCKGRTEWLAQKREAGKKGGEASAQARGKHKPSTSQAPPKQTASRRQAKGNPSSTATSSGSKEPDPPPSPSGGVLGDGSPRRKRKRSTPSDEDIVRSLEVPLGWDLNTTRAVVLKWARYRRGRKQPLTAPSYVELVKQHPTLESLSAAVNHSIASGYQGCHAPPKAKGRGTSVDDQTLADVAREIREEGIGT